MKSEDLFDARKHRILGFFTKTLPLVRLFTPCVGSFAHLKLATMVVRSNLKMATLLHVSEKHFTKISPLGCRLVFEMHSTSIRGNFKPGLNTGCSKPWLTTLVVIRAKNDRSHHSIIERAATQF